MLYTYIFIYTVKTKQSLYGDMFSTNYGVYKLYGAHFFWMAEMKFSFGASALRQNESFNGRQAEFFGKGYILCYGW